MESNDIPPSVNESLERERLQNAEIINLLKGQISFLKDDIVLKNNLLKGMMSQLCDKKVEKKINISELKKGQVCSNIEMSDIPQSDWKKIGERDIHDTVQTTNVGNNDITSPNRFSALFRE